METVAPFKEVVEEIEEAGGQSQRFCFQCGLCDTVCPWNKVRQFSMRKIIREATFGLTEIDGEEVFGLIADAFKATGEKSSADKKQIV